MSTTGQPTAGVSSRRAVTQAETTTATPPEFARARGDGGGPLAVGGYTALGQTYGTPGSVDADAAAAGANGGAAAALEAGGDNEPLGRKLNLLEFLLYNSLIFGMCFAKKGGPPVFACPLAGCCCMALPPQFDVRHRLWMFFFTLWFTFFLSVPVAYGTESPFWLFLALAFVVAPLTCLLRCHLLRFSLWAQRLCPCAAKGGIRAEEVILILLYLAAVLFAALTATSTGQFILAFDTFWKAWLLMIALDLLNLLYKYLCCFLCCKCCIPREDVFRKFMHWRAGADVPNNDVLVVDPPFGSSSGDAAVATGV